MKTVRRLFSSVRGYVRLRAILLVLIAGAIVGAGAPPEPDDYSAINQGQLKNLVKAAVQEMNEKLSTGAGQTLDVLVAGWAIPKARTDDYAAVNLGQLKAVAKLIYDRFQEEGHVTGYPWDNSAFPPDDFAMANVGQAKNLFAFDLTTLKFNAYHAPGGDGIAYQWKRQYGLDPNNTSLASQMAPGGLTYLQKYQLKLNPKMVDTDGDGVPDGADPFPNDSRRSDYIPPKFYAVIDLSAYLPDEVKATFNAEQVALDDNHNVAFFGTADTRFGKLGHLYQWQNGTLTEPWLYTMESPDPGRHWVPMNTSELWIFSPLSGAGWIDSGLYHTRLTVHGINTARDLADSTTTDYQGWLMGNVERPPGFPPWPIQVFIGAGSISHGGTFLLTPPGPVSSDPFHGISYGDTIAVDNGGHKLAWDSVWKSTATVDNPHDGYYRFRTVFDDHEIPELSEGSTTFPAPDQNALTSYGLNNHGAFLVSGWVDDEADLNFLKHANMYCEAGLVHDAPDGILQMNATHQAIGYPTNYATHTRNGWFGMETSTGVWTTFTLLDLLKWTHKPAGTRDDWQKFHNALDWVHPKFISDADPATARAVIAERTFPNGVPRYIMFTADFADGPAGGGTANGSWTAGDFVLEFDRSGANPGDWHYRLSNQNFPPGVSPDVKTMNFNGSLAGIGDIQPPAQNARAPGNANATPAAAARPLLLLPFELNSDLNNDGKAGEGSDSSLKTAGAEDTASDVAKEKATEYLFVNDQLSNGAWDKEDADPNKPASETKDDDAKELKTICAATFGAVWFEYEGGDISKLAFYKTQECTTAGKITFPFALSETNKLPDKLYVRAEGDWTAQVEGKLVMKLGKADKSETWATDKLRFTVVNQIGDTKYFQAARDYMLEQNTRLHVRYFKSGQHQIRITAMRHESTDMKAIETFHINPQIWGMPNVVAASAIQNPEGFYDLILNGNFCYFGDGGAFAKRWGQINNHMTDRCHGGCVVAGAKSPATSIGGATDLEKPIAKYLSANGKGTFAITQGIVPLTPIVHQAALGGFAGNLNGEFKYNNHPWFGIAEIGSVTNRKKIIFTVTVTKGSTQYPLVDLIARLTNSGQTICVAGDGGTSCAVAHRIEGDITRLKFAGPKHYPNNYRINTYVGFKSDKPRP